MFAVHVRFVSEGVISLYIYSVIKHAAHSTFHNAKLSISSERLR